MFDREIYFEARSKFEFVTKFDSFPWNSMEEEEEMAGGRCIARNAATVNVVKASVLDVREQLRTIFFERS